METLRTKTQAEEENCFVNSSIYGLHGWLKMKNASVSPQFSLFLISHLLIRCSGLIDFQYVYKYPEWAKLMMNLISEINMHNYFMQGTWRLRMEYNL